MKIAVIGSINYDQFIQAERIPKKGETVHGYDVNYGIGGKGANQAVAIARLGGEVTIFSCVGADRQGEWLIRQLAKEGVDTRYIQRIEGVTTGVAFITIGEKDNTIVVVPGANNEVNVSYIDSINGELKTYDTILIQNEIPNETITHIVERAKQRGQRIVYNPAPAREIAANIMNSIDYITPNQHEAELLFGYTDSLDKMVKEFGGKLIITLGAEGVIASTKKNSLIRVKARKTEVIDTTGAGDTFNGALTYMLSLGKDLEEAIQFANVAASLSTEKLGAQEGMPTFEKVEKTRIKENL